MDDPGSPSARHSRPRSRRRIGVAAGLVTVVAVLGLAGCSGGGDSSAAPTTTISRGTKVDLPLGDVSAASAGPAVAVTPAQSQAVLDVLSTYVKDATVQPLRSAKPATADLTAVFDPTTLTPATTTDRGVVFDEGLPKVTGDLDVVSQPIAIVGLGDQGGNLTLASAAVLLDVKGQTATKNDPIHIVRRADLVLAPDASGAWKVTAYSMVVTREGGGLGTPTTTTSSTATTGAAK
jgi:hypothetical protein